MPIDTRTEDLQAGMGTGFVGPAEQGGLVAAPPNRLILKVPFGRGGQGQNYQLQGWSHPEDGFTWALSPGFGLRLPLDYIADDVAVLIDVEPAWITARCPGRRTVVSLDGRTLLDVEISRRSTYLLDIGSVAGGAPVELRFRVDEVTPAQAPETRSLALAFRTVHVIAGHGFSEQAGQRLPAIRLPELEAPLHDAVEARVGVPANAFVVRFESMGHSCDFGLFQRRCGAEPLGLLRFGAISTPNLVDALLSRFDRLGLAENVSARVRADWNGEYMTADSGHGLIWHTGVFAAQASPEQLVARELFRLPFLKRLFLEVLDEASKIFVLRRPDHMDVAEAMAVAAALRLHADNVLLWADTGRRAPPGSVEAIAPSVFRGQLDSSPGGGASIQAWLSLCINTASSMHGRSCEGQARLGTHMLNR